MAPLSIHPDRFANRTLCTELLDHIPGQSMRECWGKHPATITQNRNAPTDGSEQSSSPAAEKWKRESTLSQGSWMCMPTALRVPPSAGRASWKVWVLPALDIPICCVMWEQQLLLRGTLDSGDALLHMSAPQRQEGGQGSHHPAQEDDAALFRLQQQWFFPDQRTLSMAGQFYSRPRVTEWMWETWIQVPLQF